MYYSTTTHCHLWPFRAVLPCLRPYPAEAMDGYTVAPLVSSERNDGPELVRLLSAS